MHVYKEKWTHIPLKPSVVEYGEYTPDVQYGHVEYKYTFF